MEMLPLIKQSQFQFPVKTTYCLNIRHSITK